MTEDKAAKFRPSRMCVPPHEELADIRPGWVSAALGRDLSPMDWQAHAVAVPTDHASGDLITGCGHRLLMVTALRGEPSGRVCPCCIGWSPR
jgi:hypothetical protein